MRYGLATANGGGPVRGTAVPTMGRPSRGRAAGLWLAAACADFALWPPLAWPPLEWPPLAWPPLACPPPCDPAACPLACPPWPPDPFARSAFACDRPHASVNAM